VYPFIPLDHPLGRDLALHLLSAITGGKRKRGAILLVTLSLAGRGDDNIFLNFFGGGKEEGRRSLPPSKEKGGGLFFWGGGRKEDACYSPVVWGKKKKSARYKRSVTPSRIREKREARTQTPRLPGGGGKKKGRGICFRRGAGEPLPV